MYSGYCTTQRKENRRGNRNIYRGVVKNPTIRMKMRNDKRRTVTIADLKSGELKTIRDRRKNQI